MTQPADTSATSARSGDSLDTRDTRDTRNTRDARDARDARDTAVQRDAGRADLDETLDHWGQRVGEVARATVTRLQQQVPRHESGSESDADVQQQDRLHRAERLVDDLTNVAKRYGSVAGRQILRATARAREEIDDIRAEAHSRRDQHEAAMRGREGMEEAPLSDGEDRASPMERDVTLSRDVARERAGEAPRGAAAGEQADAARG
jgi:hypothetical protein